MAYLLQSSSTIPNSTSFTYSVWWRFPASSFPGTFGNTPLFNFLNTSGGEHHVRMFIQWDDTSHLYTFMSVQLPSAQFTTTAGPAVTSGAWHHSVFAFDGTNQIYYVRTDAATPPTADRFGTLVSDQFANNWIAGTSIPFTGMSIGIPYTDTTLNAVVEFSDTQFWNSFIDVSTSANYAKLVTLNGTTGTPASTSGAATAFGTQNLLFKGKASAFYTNRGSAGAFTKVGTLTDFTPGPSF